jgi:hypothetical protein
MSLEYLDKNVTFKQVAKRFIISALVFVLIGIACHYISTYNRNARFEKYFGVAYPTSRNAAVEALPTILHQTERMKETLNASYGATEATKLAPKDLDEACAVGDEALRQYDVPPDGFSDNLREVYQCNAFFTHHQ